MSEEEKNKEENISATTKEEDVKSDKENTFQWYSLRVISGKEKTIEQSIEKEVEKNKIKKMFGEVFIPYEKVVEVRNNKKKIKERMFFPGYILIKMAMTPQTKYVIENTTGVLNFVGPKGSMPVALREDEIRRIFGEVERKEGQEVLVTPYKKGDPVKVISGPFMDFNGI